MKRRTFLISGVATGLLSGLGGGPARAALSTAAGAVVLTDITADTDPAAVLGRVQALLDHSIWVTCAVRLPDDPGQDAALADLLHRLIGMGSGLDFCLDLPDLSTLTPYFQSRRLFEARARLQTLLGTSTEVNLFKSVLCDDTDAPTDPSGIRASGLRTMLVRPAVARPVSSESWENGVVRFFGGTVLDATTPFSPPDPAQPAEAQLFYLSAAALTQPGQPDDWIAGFATHLQQAELSGTLALMTVSDLQLRDDFDVRRLVSVVLDLPASVPPDLAARLDSFRADLDAQAIPLATKPEGAQFWLNPQDDSVQPIGLRCDAPGPVQITAPEAVENGYTLRFSRPGLGEIGMDGCAVMTLPVVRLDMTVPTPDFLARLTGAGDLVVMLSPDQLDTPPHQQAVLEVLNLLAQDPLTRLTSLTELVVTLHATEDIAQRLRLTRAARATISQTAPQTAPAAPDDAERARLMADAQKAWAFFASFTNKTTGLCPATINLNSSSDIQLSVTMWDVGSNLNAIVAASDLGLITKDQAIQRIRTILPHIAGRKTEDGLLPQGWIRVDRNRWGTRNFDACDTGRLLASLDNIRRRLGLEAELTKLVASWDLDKVIRDGEIYSITNRERFSAYGSHCAHYTALAARRWGFDIRSPYETFGTRAPGDGEMTLLAAAAEIGPLGAEPLLLEAVELGMSTESAYLADVLLTAQQEEFRASGRLLCVSESPLNRPPWFIYQGLAMGVGLRAWRLDTVGHLPDYMTAAAADEYMTFSTKAAYLWAACRPGDFSAQLLAYARQKSEGRPYFAPGTNVRTGTPQLAYSDLNTNGIILEAIAHQLRAP